MNKTTREATPGELWNGSPHPLGATWNGEGVNFALYARNAEKVELCLFDDAGKREVSRFTLRERTDFVWHGYLPQVRPGQLYGYRVHGPYKPEAGHRFNPHKLLLDPYARSIVGSTQIADAQFGYPLGGKREDLALDRRDSAACSPKSQVIDSAFDWSGERRPQFAANERIIYELHVGGYTKRHPDVIPAHQGKYAGLATRQVIEHMQSLGVTTIELLPVHWFLDERPLTERGLVNYWGYNSIGFFAPASRYGVANPVNEFKAMVKTLHSAGFEVILDVVFNHTGEGNEKGPTICFRGIDNLEYYRLGDDKRFNIDFTGCGNTLDLRNPRVLQVVLDSLRYWATEMHVDGFRFDLATTLARENPNFDTNSRFFAVLRQDPVLSRMLLIAEPWDLGDGGYQVGHFPPGWAEWNDQYRDTMRAYWKGDGELIDDFARRLTGSHDLYGANDRGPMASVNFLTAHDGFTLNDLVSYNEKHNEANGEDNRDGESHNRGWNCGAEGPSDDPEVLACRSRQQRNLITTLLLSQGIPMLLGGDEIGRTQQGNNNAYCQDNEISWFDWDHADTSLLEFTRRVIQIQAEHPIFRRRRWFQGRPLYGSGVSDINWFRPDGQEMSSEDWQSGYAKSLGVFLNGDALRDVDPDGSPVRDDSVLLFFNAHHEPVTFTVPRASFGARWTGLVDTRAQSGECDVDLKAGDTVEVGGRTVVVVRRPSTRGA